MPEPSAAATSDLSQLSQHLWSDVNQTDIVLQGERRIIPDHYRTLALDESTLKAILATAPMEFSAAATPSEIWLPLPDGNMERFHFVESPIMEPGPRHRRPYRLFPFWLDLQRISWHHLLGPTPHRFH